MTHERMLHILTLVEEHGTLSYGEGSQYQDCAKASSIRARARKVYNEIRTLLDEEVTR